MLRPDRLLRKQLRSRYLVTLDSEETFEGVLVDADAAHLVLEDASSVALNGARVSVDGRLWLPRSTVKYMTSGT